VGEPAASDANLADTPRRFRFWHHSIMKRTDREPDENDPPGNECHAAAKRSHDRINP
jgi:hypothetical protein